MLFVVPVLLNTLPLETFLLCQSFYYLITVLDDPLHHGVACLYLLSSALIPRADNQMTAVLTCISEILIGAVLCPWIPRSISIPLLLLGRLIVHPLVIRSYVHAPFAHAIHVFFFCYAVWTTITKIAQRLRAGPYVLVWIRGILMGVRTVCVDDVVLAKAIVNQSTDKGSFIEDVVSTSAWMPLRSTESASGKEWIDLRAKLTIFMTSLPELSVLRKLAAEETRVMATSIAVIDSPAICRLSTVILLRYICHGQILSPAMEQVAGDIVKASTEWRKELSLKGRGNTTVKQKAINSLSALLFLDPNNINHILQPFFISPVINISDVMCAVEYGANLQPDEMVYRAIMKQHPFPFLERYVNKAVSSVPGHTQVFIPLAEMAAAHPDERWMCFSTGPRSCPGKHIATAIMTEFVSTLASSPLFRPNVGHLYSGRGNDRQIGDGWYCMQTMAQALFAPYRSRCAPQIE